jgi:transcriptional regulator GlxA family with amidase domain
MHVTLLVPGFGYPSPLIGPYEVFSSAGALWPALMGEPEGQPCFEVITASVDGRPVRYLGGISVKPDKALSQVRKTDLIFIPSIGLDLDAVLNKNARMVDFLRRHAERGTVIAGVCTGVALMAEAGILDGHTATTHWALGEKYSRRYPNVKWNTEKFIHESGNLVTGGGVYASLDVCLYLVERFAGYEIAKQTGRSLLIDAPRTWQSSFSVPLLNQQHTDERIKDAQNYIHKYFNAQFTIEELAQRVGMSNRNFIRRFKQATNETPLNYMHKLRINCARQLLETDYKSVQEVCYEVGYEDVPFFRNIFKRYAGLSPKQYRQRYGRQQQVS